jgi:hypothetical protein
MVLCFRVTCCVYVRVCYGQLLSRPGHSAGPTLLGLGFHGGGKRLACSRTLASYAARSRL